MKIGIDLGGSHVGIGLVEKNGEIIYQNEHDITQYEKKNIESTIEKIMVELIEEVLQTHRLTLKQIELIGIGSPGTIIDGRITNAVNLGIKDFAIADKLKQHFDINIMVRNDGVCAGLCEKVYGSLRPYKDCVFLCLGTGIGGAVFINNQLMRLKNHEGFEIGHMCIDKNGIGCSCGNIGCFEKYASMKVLKDKIRTQFNLNKQAHGKVILDLMKKQKENPELKQILETFIYDLSIGIINVINLFEPEAISIGGSFVHYQEVLLEKLIKQIQTRETFNHRIPKILPATSGNNAGIIGATIIE